ncbi:hypothetical protein [Croceibacterium mercuriale]|nr:hypothetical protein [Croceibacterium mercuriale]
MQMLPSNDYGSFLEIRLNYPGLIRAVMRDKRVTKTQLKDAKIIRKCTWRCFDDRLDRGDISAAEMERILRYLDINLVQASLALVCLGNADEYFEPTCETAALLAQALIVSLTQQVTLLDGNFNPLKQALCASIGERHASNLIEHQRRLSELQARDLSLD